MEKENQGTQKKPIFKKWWFWVIIVVVVVAIASSGGEDDKESNKDSTVSGEQGKENIESAKKDEEKDDSLGDYSVVIDSCRLAKDYEGKDVVIVKYIFTNIANDDSTAFYVAFDDVVYQNGVGLNESYVLSDSANYSADNQRKEIKKGTSLDVEVAYELNDTTTNIDVEVKELFSFDDKVLTKTFQITQ